MMFLDAVITTWVFWPFLLAFFALFTILSENNHGTSAGIVLIATLTGFQLFSSFQPLTYIIHNPVEALWLGGAYFIVGFIYMYVKWSFVAYKASEWFRANPDNDYGYTYNGSHKLVPFVVYQWKSNLATWFVFWPFSGAWTLLNDPIRIIFDTVYVWSSNRLQNISDSFFKV